MKINMGSENLNLKKNSEMIERENKTKYIFCIKFCELLSLH